MWCVRLRLCGLGVLWAAGMYCLARAYTATEASVIAPFEYAALPITALWGFLIWQEVPTQATWIGAALTIGSGLYLWHTARQQTAVIVPAAASTTGDHPT